MVYFTLSTSHARAHQYDFVLGVYTILIAVTTFLTLCVLVLCVPDLH